MKKSGVIKKNTVGKRELDGIIKPTSRTIVLCKQELEQQAFQPSHAMA